MKPTKHLTLVKGDNKFTYFAVEKKSYQSFTELKTIITLTAEENKVVDNKLILECFSMLQDVQLNEIVYYHKEIDDFIDKASKYFLDYDDFYFVRDAYIEPGTGRRFPTAMNGFYDLLFYVVQDTIRKQRREKINKTSHCIINLIRAMKDWLIGYRKTTKYKKAQIWAIAGYIGKHYFGEFEDRKVVLDDNCKPQEYYKATKDSLKHSKALDDKYYRAFTTQD